MSYNDHVEKQKIPTTPPTPHPSTINALLDSATRLEHLFNGRAGLEALRYLASLMRSAANELAEKHGPLSAVSDPPAQEGTT